MLCTGWKPQNCRIAVLLLGLLGACLHTSSPGPQRSRGQRAQAGPVVDVQRTRARAFSLAELAQTHFRAGRAEQAEEVLLKAEGVAAWARLPPLLSHIREQRLLVHRYVALNDARRGRIGQAIARLEQTSLRARLDEPNRADVLKDLRLLRALTPPRTRHRPRQASRSAPSRLRAEPAFAHFGRRVRAGLFSAHAEAELPGGAIPVPDTGTIDPQVVRQVVQAHLAGMNRCYDRALKGGSTLKGRVAFWVMVRPQGTVMKSRIQTPRFRRTRLGHCMQKRLKSWRFPPFSGAPQPVELSFVLSRAGF